MESMQSFSCFKPGGTSALPPVIGRRSGKPSLNPFYCLKRAGALHETAAFFAVHVRSDELGGFSRLLLLRYRKEGCVVEEQVLTHTQEVAEEGLQIEAITDLSGFNTIAEEWDGLIDRSGIERLFVSHAWLRTWWEAFGGNQ